MDYIEIQDQIGANLGRRVFSTRNRGKYVATSGNSKRTWPDTATARQRVEGNGRCC